MLASSLGTSALNGVQAEMRIELTLITDAVIRLSLLWACLVLSSIQKVMTFDVHWSRIPIGSVSQLHAVEGAVRTQMLKVIDCWSESWLYRPRGTTSETVWVPIWSSLQSIRLSASRHCNCSGRIALIDERCWYLLAAVEYSGGGSGHAQHVAPMKSWPLRKAWRWYSRSL